MALDTDHVAEELSGASGPDNDGEVNHRHQKLASDPIQQTFAALARDQARALLAVLRVQELGRRRLLHVEVTNACMHASSWNRPGT